MFCNHGSTFSFLYKTNKSRGLLILRFPQKLFGIQNLDFRNIFEEHEKDSCEYSFRISS